MADPTVTSVPEQDRSLAIHAPLIISLLVIFGFFALIGVLAFHDVPEANANALMQLSGVLATGFAGVLGYFVGSSQSSRAKDQAITNLSK